MSNRSLCKCPQIYLHDLFIYLSIPQSLGTFKDALRRCNRAKRDMIMEKKIELSKVSDTGGRYHPGGYSLSPPPPYELSNVCHHSQSRKSLKEDGRLLCNCLLSVARWLL